MTDNILVQLPNGFVMKLEAVHSGLISEIFFHDVYDKYHEYKQGEIVVDAGAHYGTFTLKAAAQGCMVHSFEPHPANFKSLMENIQRNKCANVICHGYALGSKEGIYKLWLHSLSGSHSLKFKEEDKWIPVQMTTLDSIMKEEGVDHIALLKIDIEGTELELLQGAESILEKTQDVSIAAYHFPDEAEIIADMLKKAGFMTNIKVAGPYADTRFVYGKRT
jgi:FkbM family methyltransferase